MKKVKNVSGLNARSFSKMMQSGFPGYPIYASSEDIYSKFKNEKELNPEDIYKMLEQDYTYVLNNENDLNINSFGAGIEIPFQELHSVSEFVGFEVDENKRWCHQDICS